MPNDPKNKAIIEFLESVITIANDTDTNINQDANCLIKFFLEMISQDVAVIKKGRLADSHAAQIFLL